MADENQTPAAPAPTPVAAPSAPATHAAQPAASPSTREIVAPALLSELERARSEAAAFRAELAKRDKADEETKATLAQLNEKVQLTEKQKTDHEAQRRKDRVREAVRVAAVKHDAVSEAQLLKLLDGDLTVDEKGEPVSAADPKVGAEEYVKKFLQDNPHLRKSRASAGSGASPFPAQSAPQAPRVDLSTNEGLTAYARGLTHRQPPATPNPGHGTGGPGRGV
jgi:hypothetical protein